MTSRVASIFFTVASGKAAPNRWLIAAASCLMQAALGSVYAASVFLPAIMEQYGADRREANLVFTIAIVALGITAGFGGDLSAATGRAPSPPRAPSSTGSARRWPAARPICRSSI